jgi:hypothetical protein
MAAWAATDLRAQTDILSSMAALTFLGASGNILLAASSA